ncbi:MAG: lysylphosphatidylglycerol synthase transmembrane domain-containing protein [Solirubrobacteraceae bacterium]
MAEREHDDDSGGLQIDRRRALIAAAVALLLAGGAFAAIGQAAHFDRLTRAVGRAHKPWLAVCVAGQLVSYVGYMLAYRDAARATGGPRFDLPTVARLVIFGRGASVLGASVGGLAVDYWALRRTGTHAHTAARRVLALGTIEWTVLSLYACTAAALVLITGAQAPVAMAVCWLAVVPACVLGALWFTSARRVKRFTDPPPHCERQSGDGRLRDAVRGARDHLRAGLGDAIAGVLLVRHLLSHPVRYNGAAIGYPIYWAGDILTLYAALRCFGAQPPLIPLILAYATSYVITALPLPAGGAGGIEAGMSLALHAVGVALAPALLGAFLYRVVTFWLPIVPALGLLPSVGRLQDRLPRIPHTRPDSDERIPFRDPQEA